MTKKILPLLAAFSAALIFNACGDDSSSSAPVIECLDNENCLEESSSSEEAKSSSSVKGSSSSEEAKSSSSVKEDGKSSSSENAESSSSVTGESSSSEEAEEGSSSSEKSLNAFVFGSDYKTGELRWIEDGKLSEKKLAFHQDSRLVNADGKIFVLERAGVDNVSLIDADKKSVVWQSAMDDYSNPSDIVLIDETYAWVALEDEAAIIKISAVDGVPYDAIFTDEFASEGAMSPNLVDLEVSGDTLFAIFQRYVMDPETWATTYPKGLLALYNLNTGDLLDTIQLATENPMAVKVVKGNVYVATHASYNSGYGTDADDARGIEKIDLVKKTSALYISGAKLGGGVIAMDVDYKNAIAYACIRGAFYGSAPAVEINLATGAVKTIEGIADAEGGVSFNATAGVALFGDRSFGSEAVYVYDGTKATKLESAAEDAIAPYSIVLY